MAARQETPQLEALPPEALPPEALPPVLLRRGRRTAITTAKTAVFWVAASAAARLEAVPRIRLMVARKRAIRSKTAAANNLAILMVATRKAAGCWAAETLEQRAVQTPATQMPDHKTARKVECRAAARTVIKPALQQETARRTTARVLRTARRAECSAADRAVPVRTATRRPAAIKRAITRTGRAAECLAAARKETEIKAMVKVARLTPDKVTPHKAGCWAVVQARREMPTRVALATRVVPVKAAIRVTECLAAAMAAREPTAVRVEC